MATKSLKEAASAAPHPDDGAANQADPYADPLETLKKIGEHRFGLYKFPKQGYAAHKGGPFLPEDHANAMIDAGVVRFEPSGGAHGSIKITAKGRKEVANAEAADAGEED